MESLRVPKHRALVDVVWGDGTTQAYEVFLADSAPGHAGPERVSDLLSTEVRFVPARGAEKQDVVWLNLERVAALRAAPDLDPLSDVDTLPTEHEVEVFLSSGGSFRGLATYVRPDEHSRLTDFLNDGCPFIRLLDGATVVFVNKRQVLRIVMVGWTRGAP